MTTLILIAAIILLSSPAIAQQRVIVEKATGNIVDVGDSSLQYDARYFDNLTYNQSPIPAGANFRKYKRDAVGDIVLRGKDDLAKNFADEWQKDLIAKINAASIGPDLKAVLLELVKGMRR
jgi:hypothetical protein